MKKIFLPVLLLTAAVSFSQDLPKFELTKDGVQPIVVNIDSFTVQSLYKKSLNWVQENYKNPKEVLKSDIENETIRISGMKNNACYYNLTTFKEFLSSTTFKSYGQSIELYPYRWYEIERIWEKPLYHILSSSLDDGRQRSTILANKIPVTKAAIRVVTWTVSGIAMFILTEYLLRPLIKSWFHIG